MAFSVSRCVLTEIYSPTAIDNAPAAKPAIPAVKINAAELDAPATPATMEATETIPSFAPNTAALNQLSVDPDLSIEGDYINPD